MYVEGECLRDGFRGLNLGKVDYPAEIDVHLGNSDENTAPIGRAHLSLRSDGNLWAEFVLSDLDVAWFEANPFFAVELADPQEDGTQTLVRLALTNGNQDPDLQPAKGF